jgi:probable F420-dependent oxidoreductase
LASARYTIQIYNYGPDDVVNLAVHAERLGFAGLWTGEHYVIPEVYTSVHPTETGGTVSHKVSTKAVLEREVRIYDPWFLLGVVAGVTSTLMLGTAVVVAPLNHPLLLARHTISAHDLSGGRFMLGTAAGWLREEFDALGVAFDERGSRLDETIEILQAAWRGGYFSHRGRHFAFDSLQISPHPVHIPLVCGGNSAPALRRAARVGDAWFNSSNITLDRAEALRDELEAQRRAAGTASSPFTYYVKPLDNADVPGFVARGFEDIVIWGPNAWSNDPSIPLEQKVRHLEAVAAELGVASAAAGARS